MDRADEVHVQVLFSTLMEPEAPNTGRAVTSIASDEAPGPGPEEGSVGDELQPPDERTTASASVKPWSKRIGLPDYSRDYSGLTSIRPQEWYVHLETFTLISRQYLHR